MKLHGQKAIIDYMMLELSLKNRKVTNKAYHSFFGGSPSNIVVCMKIYANQTKQNFFIQMRNRKIVKGFVRITLFRVVAKYCHKNITFKLSSLLKKYSRQDLKFKLKIEHS